MLTPEQRKTLLEAEVKLDKELLVKKKLSEKKQEFENQIKSLASSLGQEIKEALSGVKIITNIDSPKVQFPEIVLPKITIPDIKVPDIKMPDIHLPQTVKGEDGKEGKRGSKGEKGEAGKDGSADTGAEIVSKINQLEIKPVLQIDVSHIKGGTNLFRPIVGGAGSVNSIDLGSDKATGILTVDKGGTGTGIQFTQGSVIFAGINGTYSQNNANFFWDNTNNRLGIGTSNPLTRLHVGLAGTTLGTIGLAGNTSGLVTIQPAAVAGTWTFTLPTTGGTNNYSLTTDGTGIASWSQISLTAGVTGTLPVGNGGTGATTFTANGILYGNTASTIQVTAQGGVNTVLTANAGAPSFSSSPTIGTSVTTPLVIGGTGVTSTLTLRSTSGVGAAGADIIFQTGNNGATEAMRILNSGNVGIGTTGPSYALDVVGSGDSAIEAIRSNTATDVSTAIAPTLRVHNSNTTTNNYAGIAFTTPDSSATTRVASFIKGVFTARGATSVTGDLAFTTVNAGTAGEVMRITSAGNVGIGTTGPTAVCHLKAGVAAANGAPLKLTSGTNLTTPETGAIEYNGTNLFFTRTGTTRESVICANAVNVVSPTAPNRTITVIIDGTTYYLAAKTTND